MLKNNKGFTLIEMLIVLMIISVLIILIVPNLGDKGSEVHSKGCDALVSVVQAQVDAFYLEKGVYPVSLDAMIPDYINKEQETCQNGKKLGYSLDGSKGTVSIPE
ncbi:competence type IV pilus major pilin ComGC [Oceanobacillus saliphilus]|uniref:competence type IV pilus major pilin ComGC n=1 Tax=Oceanobacillus saliphilus TaxID=2925834 RepID=UPI00201E305F|nr:competence type IV pilus major pilin ComGC [Oceanobacillus saliphilus]